MDTMNVMLPFAFIDYNAHNVIVDMDRRRIESVHVCFKQCLVRYVIQLAFRRINCQSRCFRYNNDNIVLCISYVYTVSRLNGVKVLRYTT